MFTLAATVHAYMNYRKYGTSHANGVDTPYAIEFVEVDATNWLVFRRPECTLTL